MFEADLHRSGCITYQTWLQCVRFLCFRSKHTFAAYGDRPFLGCKHNCDWLKLKLTCISRTPFFAKKFCTELKIECSLLCLFSNLIRNRKNQCPLQLDSYCARCCEI